MANIEKRNNSYRIKVSCGYNADGKQVLRSMTWKPEANLTAKQIEKELQRQTVLFEQSCKQGFITSAMKFEAYARLWFKEYGEINMKPTTMKMYHGDEKRVFKAFGHMRMDKITSRDIQRFVSELFSGSFDGKKMAVSSIKNHVKFMSAVFRYAIKNQMLSVNPCSGIVYPKDEKREREHYTLEEAQQFLDLLQKERKEYMKYVVFFTVALYTGFRKSEILGLEWSDVDFENCLLTVNRTSNYTPATGIYTGTPKSKRSYRSLKIPVHVIDLIKRYREYQDDYKASLGSKWTETNRLFTSMDGKPMSPGCVSDFLKDFFKRTGMKKISPHGFRHTNASLMIFSGVDVKTVQACLGHQDAETTLDIYAHAFEVSKARAMEAVANAIDFKDTSVPDKNREEKAS